MNLPETEVKKGQPENSINLIVLHKKVDSDKVL